MKIKGTWLRVVDFLKHTDRQTRYFLVAAVVVIIFSVLEGTRSYLVASPYTNLNLERVSPDVMCPGEVLEFKTTTRIHRQAILIYTRTWFNADTNKTVRREPGPLITPYPYRLTINSVVTNTIPDSPAGTHLLYLIGVQATGSADFVLQVPVTIGTNCSPSGDQGRSP